MKKPSIIFENKNFFVVEKPAGWVVYGSNKDSKKYLSDFFNEKFSKELSTTERKGFVHRIDEDTKGLLLVAKNKIWFDKLQNLFQNREVEKWYFCECEGYLPEKGIIDSPILRKINSTKQKVSRSNKAKSSISVFYKVNYNKEENISQALVFLYTGRTHQIRAHFSSINHPIIGDKMYGNSRNEEMKLIAYFLGFKIGEEEFINKSSIIPNNIDNELNIARKDLANNWNNLNFKTDPPSTLPVE